MRRGTVIARALLLGACFWIFAAQDARAHKTSDSYLRVEVREDQVRGQWSLALHDLEFAVGLDENEDGAITWGELKSRRKAVIEYARSRLAIEADGTPVPVQFDPDLQVEQLANGGFTVLRFAGGVPTEPGELSLEYRVFFDSNRLHRGLVWVDHRGQAQQAIFNPVETRLRFALAVPRPWREFRHFLVEGVWHIWIGYDHILFLLALLLPAVLRRGEDRWHPVENLRGAFLNVVKIVTAFTLAHSVTLSLAATEVVRVPSRIVEPVIAASIIVAALNNVRPVLTTKTWGIGFVFGLVHGFGFASVLADLGLPAGSLVRALVGFNLGVELGQLAIVAVFLPFAYRLREGGFYRMAVVGGGSVAVALVASWWMIERLRDGFLP